MAHGKNLVGDFVGLVVVGVIAIVEARWAKKLSHWNAIELAAGDGDGVVAVYFAGVAGVLLVGLSIQLCQMGDFDRIQGNDKGGLPVGRLAAHQQLIAQERLSTELLAGGGLFKRRIQS